MHRRWVKWVLIGLILAAVIAIIGVVLYFTVFKRDVYRVQALEHTTDTVADYYDGSELKFYKNGTFHLQLKHKTKGLTFIAVGTYRMKDKNYVLTYTSAQGLNTENTLVDITNQLNDLDNASRTIKVINKRLKFVNQYNHQIYYFG